MLYFVSDNNSPASPTILKALYEASQGNAGSYGFDRWSARLHAVFSEFFEKEVSVFVTPTGTAANALAISSIAESFGEVLCHSTAHILSSEGGAVELLSGGCRLQAVGGDGGLIGIEQFRNQVDSAARAGPHQRALTVLSVSQPTESGTLYSRGHLEELCQLAHSSNMKVHMDGARFSNALAALGASPADCTWRRGIDVLSFGTTKNGTLNAEAVISFDSEISRRLKFLQKRAGYLTSKMRYQAVQLLAFLEDDFWLDSAKRANSLAERLLDAFSAQKDAVVRESVDTNQLFLKLSNSLIKHLKDHDIEFREWKTGVFRLVTSYCDDEAVETVERALRARS